MTQETIDAQTFKALQDAAGAEFVVDLVKTFLEEAPAMIADLQDALAGGDTERFRRVAHSLKSNSNTFGATALGLLARDLELAAKERTAVDATKLRALEHEYARAAARLAEMTRG